MGVTRQAVLRAADGLGWQALIVIVVCAGVYWVRLGAIGLTYTEGHRAIPAWEMLDRLSADPSIDDVLVPRLFGQVYLRKPPGMQWAVAASSALLGRTEFAARAVSAASMTVLALGAMAMARRWFGARWGLTAGLMQALTLLFFESGRSAEIEALNTCATGLSVLLLVDAMVWRRSVALGLAAGLCAAIALYAKGPASAPCWVGAAAGAALGARSWRVFASPAVWWAAGLAVVLGGAGWLAVSEAAASLGEPVVRESAGHFLWRVDQWARIIGLAPTALVYALPLSLALVFPWSPKAGDECADRSPEVARALAWACVISLLVYTVIGVSNVRYTLPAVSCIAPLTAYVARGWMGAAGGGRFVAGRRTWARVFGLGHPAVWPVVLAIAAGVYIGVHEPQRGTGSGRGAGIALAEHLPDGAEVWADQMIEARPEVLWYARRAAAHDGRTVTVRWYKPGLRGGPALPPLGSMLLLRDDAGSDEMAVYRDAGLADRLTLVTEGRVAGFGFGLYRVE